MAGVPFPVGSLDSDPRTRALPEGLLVLVDGEVVDANEVFCALVERARDEVIGSRPPYPFLATVAGREHQASDAIGEAGSDPMGVDAELSLPNGERKPALLTCRADPGGFSIVTVRDRSHRAASRTWLARERDFSRAVIASLREPYWLSVGPEIIDCNQAFCDMVGFERDAVCDGPNIPVFWPPEHAGRNARVRRDALEGDLSEWEATFLHADGTRFPVIGRTNPVYEQGIVVGHVTTARDVSSDRRREQALRAAAEIDGLTRTLNPLAFRTRLESVVRACEEGLPSLVLVDVDSFKGINDGHGHPVGDQVLRSIGGLLRAVAPEGAHVGRLGGDEFAVLLCTTRDEAAGIGEQIRAAVEGARFSSGLAVTVSVGVGTTAGASRCPDQLYRRADEDLYRAKREGRNRVGGAAGVHVNA